MYDRFIGSDVNITSTVDEVGIGRGRFLASGRIFSFSGRDFVLGKPLGIKAISGAVVSEEGKTVKGEFICEQGTVVFNKDRWDWRPDIKLVARLPRERLAIGDVITIRTNNGWRGESTVEVKVVEITACSPSGSTITVEPDGHDRECISITDETVEVNLYCPGSEDAS
jgi:hypothetical protein